MPSSSLRAKRQLNRKSPLERYMAALETIAAASKPGMGLTELSRRCDYSVATAHRVIQGLLHSGLIVSSAVHPKQYVVGPRLFRLLHAGTGDGWLKNSAQPVLDHLAGTLNETCFLTQLVGKKVISVARAVPRNGLRGKVYPGDVMPPHAAASAKAILAYQVDALIPHILRDRERYTIRTKTELSRIREEYIRIRRDGYATCWDELDVGQSAIAFPIEIEGLSVQYAVAVTGYTERLKQRPVTQMVEALRQSAIEIRRFIETAIEDAPRKQLMV